MIPENVLEQFQAAKGFGCSPTVTYIVTVTIQPPPRRQLLRRNVKRSEEGSYSRRIDFFIPQL